jgi:heat shock protein beta
LEESKLKDLVKKYSEFINFPIYLWASKEVDVEVPVDEDESSDEDETTESSSSDDEGESKKSEDEDLEVTKKIKETSYEWGNLNDVKALWLRNPKEVTKEKYTKFYHSSKGFGEEKPLTWSHFTAERDVEFEAVLFVPPKAPHDVYESYYNSNKANLKLYVSRSSLHLK